MENKDPRTETLRRFAKALPELKARGEVEDFAIDWETNQVLMKLSPQQLAKRGLHGQEDSRVITITLGEPVRVPPKQPPSSHESTG